MQLPLTAGDVNNPRLPEIQIQQSYAYGSSKTPILPTQLKARGRMTLREMAATIDAGVDQAEEQIKQHLEESRANLQKEARSDRARRRASRDNSREGSVGSEDREQSKSRQVAAWASSLEDVDNAPLDNIQEEPQELNDDTPQYADEEEQEAQEQEDDNDSDVDHDPGDASNKETDPSSFPSGIFDHSYSYERGLRKPNVTVRKGQEPVFGMVSNMIKQQAQHTMQLSSAIVSSVLEWIRRLLESIGASIKDIPSSPLIGVTTTILFTLLVISTASLLFCSIFTNLLCDADSVSPVSQTLQRYCGGCARSTSPISIPFNLSGSPGADAAQFDAFLNKINKQIRSLEARIQEHVDSQYASVDKNIDVLKKQHAELSTHIANLKVSGQPSTVGGDVASPVIPKINYFAPNNGARINPRLTSPTSQKPLGFYQRVLLRVFLSARYVTKGPTTALEPWQDVGDCWCASTTPGEPQDQMDTMRLGVVAPEMIYPTEVVIENYPSGGSIIPGSAPYTIELWADFDHLDSREWEGLNVRAMQGEQGSPIGSTYALVGKMQYDATAEASHVQSFALDVNQRSRLAYAAKNYVVRVPENHGAHYTCLYRVRLHGVPVFEHSS
jgi:hypothetical protein